MKFLVINGPNLNLLGLREPAIYGSRSFAALQDFIRASAAEAGVEVALFQSNHEGAIVDAIQAAYGTADGIVINPAAYTHTSVAILDALKAVALPAVEVHLSDVSAREPFRQISYAGMACVKNVHGPRLRGLPAGDLVFETVSGGRQTHDLETNDRLGRERLLHPRDRGLRRRRAAEIGPENVYNFAIGNPSIDPPDCVHAAVERLLRTVPPTQLHAYARPRRAWHPCAKKVAAYLADIFGEAYRAQDIYMTDGASSALAILTRALMGPGDEAIVFAPYFPEYAVYAEAAGGSVRVVPCRADTFALDLDALAAAVTEKTALLILNSPNNPSGVVVSRPELEALAALLREKQARYGHRSTSSPTSRTASWSTVGWRCRFCPRSIRTRSTAIPTERRCPCPVSAWAFSPCTRPWTITPPCTRPCSARGARWVYLCVVAVPARRGGSASARRRTSRPMRPTANLSTARSRT